ncbi:MAG: hypothetical protein KAQ83_01145 [Nanoarchaeota archaeon]|nr:hypothetical protein [Nanoarchaeota archaeon]
MKNTKILKNIIFIPLLLLIILGISQADSINITWGHTWRANLDSVSDTSIWSGMKIIANSDPLSESTSPFTNITFVQGGVGAYEFPGGNFDDDAHYFAAMLPNNFDSSKLLNVTDPDLNAYQMFNVSQFPDFYAPTAYDELNDNPNETFCCNKSDVTIGGINYSAFIVTLEQDTDYYVLKYNDSGVMTPIFLTLYETLNTCYSGNLNFGNQSYENNTNCDAQFMIPRYGSYNFYILSKYPSFTYRVWIDGVETIMFDNTAIPYNLTVEVRYLYNNQTAPDQVLVVSEESGHNLFIPYYLSGYVSSAYSVGETNANGRETFLVAPTAYDSTTPENYSFYLAVLLGGNLISPQTLVVNGTDELVRFKKSVSPTRLYDNAKAGVNAMNQIINYMFRWANTERELKQFQLRYDIATDTFTYYDYQEGSFTNNITLKTGAPNVVTMLIYNGGVPVSSGYTGKVKEVEGYLVMNPHTDNVTLTDKERYHYTGFGIDEDFVVTPTSLGAVESNVTFQVLNSAGNVEDQTTFYVDPTLNIVTGGMSTSMFDPGMVGSLKATINSMNSILYNLFYALN